MRYLNIIEIRDVTYSLFLLHFASSLFAFPHVVMIYFFSDHTNTLVTIKVTLGNDLHDCPYNDGRQFEEKLGQSFGGQPIHQANYSNRDSI